jgi:hypothetical protein
MDQRHFDWINETDPPRRKAGADCTLDGALRQRRLLPRDDEPPIDENGLGSIMPIIAPMPRPSAPSM